MADTSLDDVNGNAYKCRVTLMAREGKGHKLNRLLSSLTDWVDPSRQIVDVDEKLPGESLYDRDVSMTPTPGCLVSPAISVMMFMRETGSMCVKDVQKTLKKAPWHFHHKVELQNKNAPKRPVAKQEFYKLDNELPLFAACPVLTESEHIRIQFYVIRFSAMIEFYRTITETEIETNKPGFCIFELYRQPGLAIQLSLKHCQYIQPVPVKSAYISFNVKSIKDVQLVTSTRIENVGGNVYTTHDPDGNLVVLYENDQNRQDAFSELANAYGGHSTRNMNSSCIAGCNDESVLSVDDVKSLKSTAESHDSGRVSDLDAGACDTAVIKCSRRGHNSTPYTDNDINVSHREISEGYASSESSSTLTRIVGDDRPTSGSNRTWTGSDTDTNSGCHSNAKPSSECPTNNNNKSTLTCVEVLDACSDNASGEGVDSKGSDVNVGKDNGKDVDKDVRMMVTQCDKQLAQSQYAPVYI